MKVAYCQAQQLYHHTFQRDNSPRVQQSNNQYLVKVLHEAICNVFQSVILKSAGFLLSLQEILDLVRRDFFSALSELEKYRPGHVQRQSFLNSINLIMETTSSSDSKRLYISKKYENRVMMTQVIKTQGMRVPKVQTFILYQLRYMIMLVSQCLFYVCLQFYLNKHKT